MALNLPENPKLETLDDLNNYLRSIDNSTTNKFVSQVPNVCKNSPCAVGIDEAGRGPVLGPMVYGIAYCPVNNMTLLEKLECADSKALNEEKRDKIFSDILTAQKEMGFAVDIISPNDISNNMLARKKKSLNEISMDSAIGLIRTIEAAGVDIFHIYVDTVGPPEKYQAYLSKLFPNYKITVAKKADSTYAAVSAASICAKVVRDHVLQTWVFKEGLDLSCKDFGSGYPSDPVTKKFLEKYCDPVFGFPQLVRFSWSTAQKILQEKAFHCDWESVDDDSKKSSQNGSAITSFFKSTQPVEQKEKHDYFKRRKLVNVVEF